MKVKKLILILLVLGLFFPSYGFADISTYQQSEKLASISKTLSELRSFLSSYFLEKDQSKDINEDDIIFWTNIKREERGLNFLEKDISLSQVAKIRLSDMEQKQYFSHYSPEGRVISDEALDYGYSYISIGENIAQGNFKNSKDLVEAWMDSPGHRENILKNQYSKIGIAAKKVIFEGKKTWLIVQAFSRPITDCIEPSLALKKSIDQDRIEFQKILKNAEEILLVISDPEAQDDLDLYNENIATYNNLVKETNHKSKILEKNISEYNREVNFFNACLSI